MRSPRPRPPRTRVLDGLNAVLRRAVDRELRVVEPDRKDPGIAELVAHLRSPLELRYAVYDLDSATLYTVHNAGLFSNLSVTMWSIADLIGLGHVPERIDFGLGFDAYKDEPHADIAPDLFEPVDPAGRARIAAMSADAFGRFGHHGPYEALDLETLGLLRATYLRPNGAVAARSDELRRRYLDPDARYVGAWIRGTDKWSEVAPVDSAVYIDTVEAMLDAGEVDRVLVQTDQAQIRDVVTTWFEGRCDVFSALPVTSGATAIFDTDIDDGRRVDSAVDLLATAAVVADMERVVTATSNIGAWLVLLRGTVAGVHQARDGLLVPLG